MDVMQQLEVLRQKRLVLGDEITRDANSLKAKKALIEEIDRQVYEVIAEQNSPQQGLFRSGTITVDTDAGDPTDHDVPLSGPVIDEPEPTSKHKRRGKPGMDPKRVRWEAP